MSLAPRICKPRVSSIKGYCRIPEQTTHKAASERPRSRRRDRLPRNRRLQSTVCRFSEEHKAVLSSSSDITTPPSRAPVPTCTGFHGPQQVFSVLAEQPDETHLLAPCPQRTTRRQRSGNRLIVPFAPAIPTLDQLAPHSLEGSPAVPILTTRCHTTTSVEKTRRNKAPRYPSKYHPNTP